MKRTPLWVMLALILVMGWAGSVGAATLPQSTRPSGPKGKPTPTAVAAPTKAPTMAPTVEPTATPVEEPTLAPTTEPIGEPTEEPTEEHSVEPTATPAPTATRRSAATPTPAATGDGRDTTSALARLLQNTLPDGLVNLNAGTYVLDGPLVIDKSLSIVGAGVDDTLIVSDHGDAVIKVETIFADVSFSGVTFQYQGEDYANVVIVDNAAVDFADCRFTGAVWNADDTRGGDGLLLWGSAIANVDTCRFDGNDLHGIEAKEKAELTVVDSVFTENGEDGIAFFGNATGDVRDSEFFANGLHGIGSQDSPTLTLVGNYLHDNVELGVRLANQTQAEVRENTAAANGLHGIGIRDDAVAVIADNVVTNNVQSGIVLFGAATGTVTGNECAFNGLHGIGLEDESQATVEDNTCHDNGEDGIVFFGTATGVVRNNELTGNGLHGIGISSDGSPTIEDNVCSDNAETGIRLSQTTAATVRRNTCTGNGLHGIHVRDQAAPLLEDNLVADNTEVGIYFSDTATGASIRTECARNNWGIYIVDTANPWLEDNDCYDNVEVDINDERSPEQAAAAVRPTATPDIVTPAGTPTPGPDATDATVPRPNGDLIFGYDFDGGDQAPVPFFGEETMRYREADGEGILSSKEEGVVLPALFGLPPLADFFAEFDLDMPSPGPNSGYGLIFRVHEMDDIAGLDAYYLLTLHPPTGNLQFALWQDNQWATQAEAALPQDLIVTEGYVRVRIEALGSDFRVWIDDTFIAAFEDSGLLDAGDIGFSISPDPVAGRDDLAYLDNLRIYAPAGVAVSPTATPDTPTGSTLAVVLTEDFEDADMIFAETVNDEGEVWREGGELHLLNYTDSPYGTWAYAEQSVADVVVQVDSRFVAGSDNNWHQLICRSVDGDNYITAEYSADGYVFVKAVVDGEDLVAHDVTQSRIVRLGTSAVNTMRLECLGDTIRFSLNDTLLTEFTDTQPAAGDIVLGVSSLDGDYSEIAYDNLVVSAPADEPSVPATVTADAATATVTAQRLNVRDGPGANFAIVTSVRQGDLLPVLGRNADCSWVNVSTDDGEGWVSTGFVTLDADCTSLPDTTP